MSADPFREILDELGGGDEVAVAERLKTAAADLAALLEDLPGDDGQLTADRVTEILAATSGACEAFLTVAFAVVEYGQGASVDALPRALRHVTRATAAAPTREMLDEVAALAVAHLDSFLEEIEGVRTIILAELGATTNDESSAPANTALIREQSPNALEMKKPAKGGLQKREGGYSNPRFTPVIRLRRGPPRP